MTRVRIPPTLRADVGGVRELAAHGETVGDVLDDLVERYPALREQLFQNGGLASFVNVYLGGDDPTGLTPPCAWRPPSHARSST
jgi:molybdopterin synthase sulfur carrier subunit